MKRKYIILKTNKNSEKEKSKSVKTFNYGFAILKSILAFLVVAAHNFESKSTNNKIILFITKHRKFQVPSFFILSFYFMHNNLLSLNPKVISHRLMRLLIPYIGWSLIIWKINYYWNKKFHTDFPDSFEYLKLGLLWGNRVISIFWFLWNLIVITILFTIIIFIFRKHSLFILQIILVLCYSVQYSGYYNKNNILRKYSDLSKGTFPCLFEDIPFAVTGFTFAHYKIFDKLQKNKIKTFILSVLFYNFFDDYNIFREISVVLYPGVKYNPRAICVVFIFSLFPSDKIKNENIGRFIRIITNYTGPVYYLHTPLRQYLSFYNDDIKNGTFRGLFITYFIIYALSFFGMIIFGKTPFKYLFC